MTQTKFPEFLLVPDTELPTLEYAWQMGHDYGHNGPSEVICYFTLFATPELTRAWEEGKADVAAGK